MQVELPFKPIQWSDSMATGIAQIDAQHRYLVDTLSQANEKLLGDHDGAMLSHIAHELLNYAIMHFETEEELMQRYGYQQASPEAAQAHIAQHREFSRQVVAVCDRLREKRAVSVVEVLKYLNDWLRNHVLGIDQQLGAFVRAAQAKEAAAQAG